MPTPRLSHADDIAAIFAASGPSSSGRRGSGSLPFGGRCWRRSRSNVSTSLRLFVASSLGHFVSSSLHPQHPAPAIPALPELGVAPAVELIEVVLPDVGAVVL